MFAEPLIPVMHYQLTLHSSPYTSAASRTALAFIAAATARGHCIDRVFFYGDAVLNGQAFQATQADAFNYFQAWSTLATTHHIELILCIASASIRGVIDTIEAQRYQLPYASTQPPFVLAGLGQWVSGLLQADRVINFG